MGLEWVNLCLRLSVPTNKCLICDFLVFLIEERMLTHFPHRLARRGIHHSHAQSSVWGWRKSIPSWADILQTEVSPVLSTGVQQSPPEHFQSCSLGDSTMVRWCRLCIWHLTLLILKGKDSFISLSWIFYFGSGVEDAEVSRWLKRTLCWLIWKGLCRGYIRMQRGHNCIWPAWVPCFFPGGNF